MVIESAMKRDDGTYMCVAENAAGMRRALAAVRVKGQPPQSLTIARCILAHLLHVA